MNKILNKKVMIVCGVVTMIAAVGLMASCTSSSASTKKTSKTSSKSSVTWLKYVDPSKLSTGAGASTGGGGGPNTSTYDYSGTMSAALTANGKTVTKSGTTVSSTSADKNVVLAENGGVLKLKNVTLKKSGSDSNGDNCNFYGLNSSVLAVGSKSKVYLSKSTINSTSTGSNGIFATDSARIYANNVKITTSSGDNARGLDATYGGVIYGNKLTVSTSGDHCAALATDRGGGYISVTNSSLKTAGSGSPLIYSTGDIEVDNVKGTASGSQIAGMEGLNRILIYNSTLTSTNDAISGSDPIKNGVILYQSTSGDADTSTSSAADFEAVNSTLKTSISSGAMFYVTNTNAKVVLKNTKLSFDSSNVNLITASGNSNNWGTSGSNGGKLTFTAIGEKLKGNVKTDSISSVKMYLLSKTTYTGKTSGKVTMNVSKNSKWVVTGNSTVTNLNVAAGGKIVDKDGNTVTIKVNGTTKVKGDSKYTVTVTGKYTTKVTTGSKNKLSTKAVSRSAFDKYYGTTTTFGKNTED